MGIYYNTKIVRDNLVLHLDAANPKSYPGNGTTWYDLSGNGHHGTLINFPTFDSSAKGFTGFNTNEYIEIGNNPYVNIPTGTQDRTIIASFRTASNISGYQHILHYGTASSSSSYGLALLSGYLGNHTWSGNSNFSNNALSINADYIAAVRFSNTNDPKNDFFVNDVFGNTGYGQGKTADYGINTGQVFLPKIGTRISTYAEPFDDGVIKSVLIYNRFLSDNEIKQNFEAFRGRYGI